MTDSVVAPKSETLGKKLLDVRSKDTPSQEVRETTNEMGSEYMKSLWSLVDQHEHLPGIYFIMEIMQHDQFLDGVIKIKHIARRTPPKPEWGVACYKVNNTTGELTYEWGLPIQQDAWMVMQNKDLFDSKMVEDIEKHLKGELEPGIQGRFEFTVVA